MQCQHNVHFKMFFELFQSCFSSWKPNKNISHSCDQWITHCNVTSLLIHNITYTKLDTFGGDIYQFKKKLFLGKVGYRDTAHRGIVSSHGTLVY